MALQLSNLPLAACGTSSKKAECGFKTQQYKLTTIRDTDNKIKESAGQQDNIISVKIFYIKSYSVFIQHGSRLSYYLLRNKDSLVYIQSTVREDHTRTGIAYTFLCFLFQLSSCYFTTENQNNKTLRMGTGNRVLLQHIKYSACISISSCKHL